MSTISARGQHSLNKRKGRPGKSGPISKYISINSKGTDSISDLRAQFLRRAGVSAECMSAVAAHLFAGEAA